MSDGQWYLNVETQRTWSNYSQCYGGQMVTILMNVTDEQANNVTLIKVKKISHKRIGIGGGRRVKKSGANKSHCGTYLI